MIKDARLDSVIEELRMELARIDRAIAMFEKMAMEIKARRTRNSQTPPIRLKPIPPSVRRRPSAPPA